MRGQLSDPAWKSGPKEQKPTSSEHAIHPEDFGHSRADWDGFGKAEAESVEGVPLVALQEMATCSRDGCDAAHKRRLLFTTHTLTEEEERALRDSAFDVVRPEDAPQSADSETRHEVSDSALAEYVHEEGERVDAETIEVDGIGISAERIADDEPMGACYGHVEPDPEPQWRDI
jgi:hypothetical protein